MKPTVIHLADYGGPYSGSFIPMLRAIATRVRARGWEFSTGFTAVARDRPWLAELAGDGIDADFAPEGADRAALERWLAELVAQRDGPLVLHTHFTGFDLPAAVLARQRPDTSAVWHVHSYLPPGPLAFARAAVKFSVLGRGAWVICVSGATAAGARRRGAAGSRVRLIENGIDANRFDLIRDEERSSARAALGLGDGDRALLHFAWDWEVKGGPLFSETIRALRDRGIQAVGLSIGAGEHARAAAESLGLGDGLRAVEPTDDVRGLYAAADAMVAASGAEGAPLAMLEALSRGLGVVATSIPGHRLVGSPPTALRLGGTTADELAACAEQTLARSDETRAAEAASAHKWVLANRDLGVWSERVLAVYDEVLRSSGNAAATSAGGSS